MYRVLTFCRPWHHLQKVRDARQEQKGGHQKTKDIIKSEVKNPGNYKISVMVHLYFFSIGYFKSLFT